MRKDNKPAQKQVWKRYKAQKDRGSEGFGYIGIKQSGRATVAERFMFEHGVEEKIKGTTLSTILFHHRYPTSTPNLPEASHPLKVSHTELKYDYYIVHNGVIQNDDTLKTKHEKLGYTYLTELTEQYKTKDGYVYYNGSVWNDSEAFAIELARNIEGKSDKVEATGSIAYIAMQLDKATRQVIALYYGTNGGNPLTIDDTKEFLCIASEGGKAVNDHMCYRLEWPSGISVHYPQVQIPSAYQPKIGYTHATEYVGRGELSAGYDDLPPVKRSEADTELHELEQQLADLDDEIIGVAGDMEFSAAEGDLEDEETYRAEYQELIERREKLQTTYAKQANKEASKR